MKNKNDDEYSDKLSYKIARLIGSAVVKLIPLIRKINLLLVLRILAVAMLLMMVYGEFFQNEDTVNVKAIANEPKEMIPTEQWCSQATGISQGFAEFVAKSMRVSVRSVSFLWATSAGSSGCIISIDTPKGPQQCVGGTVYSDGKNVWIHGDCY